MIWKWLNYLLSEYAAFPSSMKARDLLFLPSSIIACSALCAPRLLGQRVKAAPGILPAEGRKASHGLQCTWQPSHNTVYSCRSMHEMWEKKFWGFFIMQKSLPGVAYLKFRWVWLAVEGFRYFCFSLSLGFFFVCLFFCCWFFCGFFVVVVNGSFCFLFKKKKREEQLNGEQSLLLL